jgi:hypothetical protein
MDWRDCHSGDAQEAEEGWMPGSQVCVMIIVGCPYKAHVVNTTSEAMHGPAGGAGRGRGLPAAADGAIFMIIAAHTWLAYVESCHMCTHAGHRRQHGEDLRMV